MKTDIYNINEITTAYRFLINSVSHFSDIKDIDKRAYFVTTQVSSRSLLGQTRKLISLKLNKSVGHRGTERPAVITSDDVEGSRGFDSNLYKPLYPHQHSIIIPSQRTISSLEERGGDYSQVIQNNVIGISEFEDIDVRRIDHKNSLLHVISYALKVSAKFSGEGYDFAVLPYEWDITDRDSSVITRAKQRSEDLFHQALDDPSIAFSDEYLAQYEHEMDLMKEISWNR